jgi:hypothetical protein
MPLNSLMDRPAMLLSVSIFGVGLGVGVATGSIVTTVGGTGAGVGEGGGVAGGLLEHATTNATAARVMEPALRDCFMESSLRL